MIATTSVKTVPDVACESGERLDRLREFLRKRPDLKALAQRVGGVCVYDAAAIERILAEYRASRK